MTNEFLYTCPIPECEYTSEDSEEMDVHMEFMHGAPTNK